MILEEGMTFTIEPMVNGGDWKTKLLGDKWTVVTKDHSLSAQYEHTLLVTKTGVEILTARPDEDLSRLTTSVPRQHHNMVTIKWPFLVYIDWLMGVYLITQAF